jgi:hypothetical protein
MKLNQIDSPNPYISIFTRLAATIVVLALVVSIAAEDEVWVVVPVSIVLGLLALIYSRSFAKRK